MDRNIKLSMDWLNSSCAVGNLDVIESRGQERYFFEYSSEWLNSSSSFSIDPKLPLVKGKQYLEILSGVFEDMSPDRWGKTLQDRANSKHLTPSDYMLGVSDYMRQGALRLSENGIYLAENRNVPIFTDLRTLESAAHSLEKGKITNEEMNILLDPGSSIGGARPKVIVSNEYKLYIAKFSKDNDRVSRLVLWEDISLKIAKASGINTANSFIVGSETERPMILIERFDRKDGKRIPFSSAMTFASGLNYSCTSYLEIADIVTQYSSNQKANTLELWKRMTFNSLIGNTDDHMRNHGFLRNLRGWEFSPAYDINAVPDDYNKRTHQLSFTIDGSARPSLEDCIATGRDYMRIDRSTMYCALNEMASGISQWEKIATKCNATSLEIRNMEHAFNHKDMEKLLQITTERQKIKYIKNDRDIDL